MVVQKFIICAAYFVQFRPVIFVEFLTWFISLLFSIEKNRKEIYRARSSAEKNKKYYFIQFAR